MSRRRFRFALASLVLVAALAVAQTPIVVPGSFSVLAAVTGSAVSGTQSLHVLDGDVRFESTTDGGDGLVVLFVQEGDTYALRGFFGEADEPGFETTLDAVLADDLLYADLADLLIMFLAPTSPIHPCELTPPEDGVLTGDFEVWDCTITGRETLGGRNVTVWTFEVLRGRDGQPAIINEPLQTIWIDDELGVPLAFDGGPDSFVATFVSYDPSRQEERSFTGR